MKHKTKNIDENKALNLAVVMGSIIEPSKLMTLTKQQKKENDKECTYCVFYNGMGNHPMCNKCAKENDLDQYYL